MTWQQAGLAGRACRCEQQAELLALEACSGACMQLDVCFRGMSSLLGAQIALLPLCDPLPDGLYGLMWLLCSNATPPCGEPRH